MHWLRALAHERFAHRARRERDLAHAQFELVCSRGSRAQTDALVFHQILLAALLKLCNAAENFLRDRRMQQGFTRKKVFESLGPQNDSRIRRRITPPVESPAANSTGAVLASLTFDGGL